MDTVVIQKYILQNLIIGNHARQCTKYNESYLILLFPELSMETEIVEMKKS